MNLPDVMKVGHPMPPSIGRCADLYHDIREVRLAMEKEVAEVKARETEIQEHILNTLSVGDDTGAAGLRYRAQVVSKAKPRLADWGVFTAWVRKNDLFHLIQRRINEAAVAEYMEQNQRDAVPGTEIVNVKSISITKI